MSSRAAGAVGIEDSDDEKKEEVVSEDGPDQSRDLASSGVMSRALSMYSRAFLP